MELIAGAESLWVQNVVAENLATHENNSLYGNLKLSVRLSSQSPTSGSGEGGSQTHVHQLNSFRLLK